MVRTSLVSFNLSCLLLLKHPLFFYFRIIDFFRIQYFFFSIFSISHPPRSCHHVNNDNAKYDHIYLGKIVGVSWKMWNIQLVNVTYAKRHASQTSTNQNNNSRKNYNSGSSKKVLKMPNIAYSVSLQVKLCSRIIRRCCYLSASFFEEGP